MRGDLGKYRVLVDFNCLNCGSLFKRPPNEAKRNPKFCGIKCRNAGQVGRLAGEKNPHWKPRKNCAQCGEQMPSGVSRRKYCSVACFQKSIGADWVKTDVNGNKYIGRHDDNQEQIISALKAHGCEVLVTAGAAPGVPDLLVYGKLGLVFMEVKNRATSYGRRGLTKWQKMFCDYWQGRAYLVYTPEDALVAAGVIGPWMGVGRKISIGWSINREKPAV